MASYDATAHLSHGDMMVDNVENLHVVRRSKRDPFETQSIWAAPIVHDLCPVAAILDFMVKQRMEKGPF